MPRASLERLFSIVREHLGLHVRSIDVRVRRRLYPAGASVRHCNGACCRGGTTISVDERERILAHAGVVSSWMTSRARGDTKRWFARRVRADRDFTAGATVDTRVLDGACVFYRHDGRCALQLAGAQALGHPWALKPSVCLLWPLAVQNQKLEVGYAWYTRRRECCAASRRGSLTILEVMRPDGDLFGRMARPECSRGGGPPLRARGRRRAPADLARDPED